MVEGGLEVVEDFKHQEEFQRKRHQRRKRAQKNEKISRAAGAVAGLGEAGVRKKPRVHRPRL